MEGENDFAKELMEAAQVCPECGHHHEHGEECHEHHHDHDHECHERHHDHDHECHEHHHDHDHECHEHHHDHDHECHEHHHDHDHDCCGHDHHHHHADEVFTKLGKKKLLRSIQKKEFEQFLIHYLKKTPMSMELS